MPNWCCNKLVVSGDDLDKFRETLDGDNFSLSQIVKIPKILERIHKGSRSINGITYNGWIELELYEKMPWEFLTAKMLVEKSNETNWNSEDKEKRDCLVIPVTPTIEGILQKKYGSADWYEWNLSNLGTKWDADGKVSDDGQSISVWFDTAWSPPTKWVENVIEKFPNLEIELHYSEQGGNFYGTMSASKEGFLIDDKSDLFLEDVDWDNEDEEDEFFGCTDNYREFRQKHGLGAGG